MVLKESAEAVTATVTALQSTPLALALLVVNGLFLGFSGYVMREVSHNAAERNRTQTELIAELVKDCRIQKPGG